MANEVPWNKIVLEEFISISSLTKLEEAIIRTRVAGWTRTQQALKFNISVSTVDKTIKKLKTKYDDVQKFSPILPPRKYSKEEKYMDEN